MKEFDLKNLNLPPGDYIVTIVAKAGGYRNSRPSIVINYDNPGEWTTGLKFILINESEYEVCGYEGTAEEIVVPSIYKGKPVTSIGFAAFRHCTAVTTIILPDSIRYIKDDAFNGCTSLRELELGKGISSIGNWAFLNCSSIQRLNVLNDVTKVGTEAFRGWSSSQIIHFNSNKNISNSWHYYWKYGCNANIFWEDNYFVASVRFPLTSAIQIQVNNGNPVEMGVEEFSQFASQFKVEKITVFYNNSLIKIDSSISADGVSRSGKDASSQLNSIFSTDVNGIGGDGKEAFLSEYNHLVSELIALKGIAKNGELQQNFSLNSIIDINISSLGILTKIINPIETALSIDSFIQEDIDYLHSSIDSKCLQIANTFVTTFFENVQAPIENEFFIYSFLQTNKEGRKIETGDALKASSKLDVAVVIRQIKLSDLKDRLSDYANLKLS